MTDPSGFDYLQSKPFERFRIPSETDLLSSAVAVLAFAAYPHISLIRYRQEASDAYFAWMYRRANQHGIKVTPPPHLTRRNLRPEVVRRRVFKAARLFDQDSLDVVWLGQRINFERSGALRTAAEILGAYFKAKEINVTVPLHFGKETPAFRDLLRDRKTKGALTDEKTVIRDFKRRTWDKFLPALPLLVAIHIDILKYNTLNGEYDVKLPGHGRRYLALSLLNNPDKWVPVVAQNAQVRRVLMSPQFPDVQFADILPENAEDELSIAIEGS